MYKINDNDITIIIFCSTMITKCNTHCCSVNEVILENSFKHFCHFIMLFVVKTSKFYYFIFVQLIFFSYYFFFLLQTLGLTLVALSSCYRTHDLPPSQRNQSASCYSHTVVNPAVKGECCDVCVV